MTKEQKTRDNSEEKVKELLNETKKLKEENEKLKSRKKYGIVWEEEKEPETVVLECKEKLPILKDVKDKEILTDKNKPMNILIEGDNYHALQVLNYTHKGKVDAIYIDPPYNTKKEGFMYNDIRVDRTDEYRHSKWLNFMNKRLLLAKELLKNEGVIFISIDDNEYSQLKLLCDEIFDEENFVGNIIWEKKYSPANDSKKISDTHDFVLVYKKPAWKLNLLERTEAMDGRYRNLDNDSRGPWKPGGFSVKSYSESYDYPIKTPSGGTVNPPKGSCWQTSEKNYFRLLNKNRIWFGPNGNAKPQIKQFLSEVQQGLVPKSIWFKEESGHNQLAMNLLKEIIGDDAQKFGTPKPIQLIERIIRIATLKSDAIILDFFAGSGTTGHAVMNYNKKNNCNLRYMLCTNNENEIAEKITYKRIYRIIKGYEFKGKDKQVLYENKLTASKVKRFDKIKEEIEEVKEKNKDEYDKIETNIKNNMLYVFGIKQIDDEKEGLGGNLKYFKTDFLDVGNIYNISDEKKIELTYNAGEMIALREDAFEDAEKNKWWQIFKNKDKTVAIYFREDQSKLEELFKKLKNEKATVYLFSWGKNELKAQEYGYDNITIKDIPQPIIEVYKEVNKS